jgi:ribosomal protein S18 acetylase RimI-like enzyme
VVSDLHIRRARRDDEAFILALAPRFADVRPLWRSEREVVDGTERALRTALLDAADGDHAIFIAEDTRGERLGFVFVDMDDDFFTGESHAHISEIAVARDGAGVGRALITAAETWAHEQGSRYVSLHVTARNERARALYERLGYELEHRRLTKLLG